MSKEMVISANPHETRVAILEEGQLCEYYVEREKEFALVGSIYKGRVTRVLPGMQSAFVEIGLDSDAFLYVSDFLEGIEEFDDHVATTAEEKIQKMEDQGGQAFPPNGGVAPSIEPADVEPAPAFANAPLESAGPEEARPPAPAVQPPVLNTSSPSRPRPGGRDFGRRGGGGRGRGGRFGRGGRGGGGSGGDRRYGRELPPSKYASPRPYEDRSSEPGAPEGHISTILPGESLAKFREQPPPSAASVEETPVSAASSAALEPVQESPALRSPASFEPPAETRPPARTEFRSSFGSGLEPLPGETLAKFRHAEPSVREAVEPSAPPAQHEHETEEENQETRGISEAEDRHEDHSTAELSEDEAAALAEHVAEAQSEEAAREAQERGFAAEAAADGGVSEAEAEAEEHALEEEEEEAETEGMMAPPSESEHELEREQAAAEDQADAEAESQEALQSLAETEHAMEAEAGVAPSEGDLPVPGASPAGQEQQPWKARVRDDFRARMQHPGRRSGRDRGPRRDDRGRRPHHGHGHYRTQPRRPQLIADMLKQGQEIIVQIAKEPLGKKGARITSHVALPGRFLVYMPTLDHTGVSRKIASAEERSRLRHLVNEAKGSAGGGFIVRTAAASAAPEEVRADVEFLTRTWSEIKTRSEQRKAPALLHRDLNLVERMLRDHISSDYAAIWVDSEEEYTKVVDFMSRFQPTLVNRVKLYTKETPVFEEFGIQQEIDKGLRPKVWLKSGGYIVINHTEALVAIDVNTGKFVGKGSNRLEDTIVRTNLEAVKEIVRQMRLRDLGGIIIIDFIDMEERRNREKVMAALEDALKADRAPSKMLRFNEFGLIAITRKRTKQALERTLCQPCPYCTGSGMVKSIPTLCYEIQTEARKMAPEMDSGSLTLRVHPEIAKALKTRESSLIEELERWTKKSVIIQADPTLHWEQYDIY
ncbi:MAG: Rne/Rng family ribonuclease [Candidatus Acidiferrales bacterium]|jgi:ribonuclease G